MNELLQLLVVATVALLLVWALRPVLRHWGGAAAQYQAWLLVPALLMAWLLPAPPMPEVVRAQAASLHAAAAPAVTQLSLKGVDPHSLWIKLWLIGALAVVCVGAALHGRYRSTLKRQGSHWQLPPGASAACVGVLRVRVALPVDFRHRFTRQERRLVLEHERVHAQRGDNAWVLLALVITALLWFNPLAWWSLRRLRGDLELACDAAVLRRQPGARRLYAQTLLKAHTVPPHGGLFGALRSSLSSAAVTAYTMHPIIERLQMLPRHQTPTRRAVVALAIACSAGTAMALQGSAPLQGGSSPLHYSVKVLANGEVFGPVQLRAQAHEPAVMRFESTAFGRHDITLEGGVHEDQQISFTLKLQGAAVAGSYTARFVTTSGVAARMGHSNPLVGTVMKIEVTPTLVP